MTSDLEQIFENSDLYSKLFNNNIKNIKELILKKPKKYQDFTLTELNKIADKTKVNLYGIITKEPVVVRNFFKKNAKMFHILTSRNTEFKVIIFNNFFFKILEYNKKIFIKGTYYNRYNTIIASFITLEVNIENKIKPIYNLKNISDESLQKLIKKIFQSPKFKIKETLDIRILKKYNLINRKEAFRNLHLPENKQMLYKAIQRFKYEEAFIIMKKWFRKKGQLPSKIPIKCNISYVKQMIKKIPFQLTLNQKKIVNEIYSDFKKDYPTQRLIQGDVGSGKTITVFIAALGIINLNKQVLMMAPTEILAKQHYLNFQKLFPEIDSIIITSKNKTKKFDQEQIKQNKYKMIFGTHLLANIDFFQLGLIIIDETHKFGTDLKNKTIAQDLTSDILYLTATPIPKTLALIYSGLLNISLLIEKPYNKNNIITKKCSFEMIIPLLKKNQSRNEQSYITVPAIKDNKKNFNIENMTIFLEKQKIEHLYILHSKQTTDQQEENIQNFIKNKQGILLATSIIEVGIDIENVTTIIILGAEYFGLSQLHQLRGRVGRNNKQNYCFLVSTKDNERLKILEKENNVAKLSDFDLCTRGPGDFLGKEQSGFFKFQFLNIKKDYIILNQIKKDFEYLSN
jgi:ATP-dependent DNA helicase RecG